MKLRIALVLLPVIVACGWVASTLPRSARSRAIPAWMSDTRNVPDETGFWALRASYPTGHFNPNWLIDSARQARLIAARSPSGMANGPGIFTPLGPQPLNPGPVAGRTNVIVTHPTNPAVAWIGSDGGGVWKTTNCCSAATTWALKTDIAEIQSSAIGDMTIDPNNPDVLYAATGDLRFGSFSFGSNGLLKSVDGGETWTVKGETEFNPFYPPSAGGFPQYQAIGQVKVDPNNSQRVIVGTKTGLYLTYDGGDTWAGPCLTNGFTTQRQDITGLVLHSLDEGTTTEMIAAIGTRGFETPVQPDLNQNGANGIYRGTVPASGCPTDWTLISRADNGWPAGTGGGEPTPVNTLGRVDIAISPSDSNVIYAQVARIDAAAPNILGVWRTTDRGDNWTEVHVGNIAGAGTQSWYNAGMAVHPTDPNTIILSALRSFRSTDGGTNYTTIAISTHVDHHARAFVAGDPNQLLIGTDGGVYYTANAMAASPTFISLNATLNTIELYSGMITADFWTAASSGAVAGAQDNSCMVSNWSGGVFVPQAWAVRNGGDGIYTSIEPILRQRWYYSSQYGNIVASNTEQGPPAVSASGAWSPGSSGGERKSFLMPFDLYRYGGEDTGCPAATGCRRIIAGTYRVWESVAGGVPGSSWRINSPDLTKGTLGARSFINQLSYAVSTPEVGIVGTSDGNVAYGFGLGQDVPSSAIWVDVTGDNTVLPNRPVMDVATDPNNPLVGYAVAGGFDQNTPTTPGHVFQVTCAAGCKGFIWRNVSGNLPNIPVNSVIVNPHLPAQVFAGTDWGLYYTDDVEAASPVWYRHEGLPHVMIWDMAIDRGFTTLAVFTRSRGAWAWPLPTN